MARKSTAQTAATKADNPWDEYVEFILHKDSDRYSGDVAVGINGKNYKIQRGVPVKLPRPVYEVLMDSMRADALVAEDIANAEAKGKFAR